MRPDEKKSMPQFIEKRLTDRTLEELKQLEIDIKAAILQVTQDKLKELVNTVAGGATEILQVYPEEDITITIESSQGSTLFYKNWDGPMTVLVFKGNLMG